MDREHCGPLFFLLLALVFFPAFGICRTCPLPQDKEEAAEKHDIGKICKKLGKLYKNKKNFDSDQVLACYQIFDESYKESEPKDQKKIVKAIKQVFDIRPLPKDKSVLIAAAGCLAFMGKGGKDALFYALNHKSLKIKVSKGKNERESAEVSAIRTVKVKIIEAIGVNKNKDSVKALCALLWDNDVEIVKAVCKALSYYSEFPLKNRKLITKELVKVYVNIHSLSAANPKRTDYREKLYAVEVPFNEALRAMTLRDFETAPEWEKWYNNNKSKPKW